MSLIPEEKIKPSLSMNLAPMIDFLFLMLAFFATLAVTRATIFDTQLDLVQLKTENNAQSIYPQEKNQHVSLSIANDGGYKWITEIHDYPMSSTKLIQKELLHQHSMGLLPEEKSQTKILLHIDKNAPWEPIAKLIFAIRELGFDAHPIYEPEGEIEKD